MSIYEKYSEHQESKKKNKAEGFTTPGDHACWPHFRHMETDEAPEGHGPLTINLVNSHVG